MADQETPTARLVRKIVVAYELSALPPALIRSSVVLRRKLERAGFKIEVLLRPLSQLPPDMDVLFVPAEIREIAQRAAPETIPVLTFDATTSYQAVFDKLLQQLQAGKEFYALHAKEKDDQDGSGEARGIMMRYRGHEKIS
jgi:hypothetical protein